MSAALSIPGLKAEAFRANLGKNEDISADFALVSLADEQLQHYTRAAEAILEAYWGKRKVSACLGRCGC